MSIPFAHGRNPVEGLRTAQLFIGWFREPGPPGRSLPRTIDASSGPSTEIPCTTTSLPKRHPKISVVHGSENLLFNMLQRPESRQVVEIP